MQFAELSHDVLVDEVRLRRPCEGSLLDRVREGRRDGRGGDAIVEDGAHRGFTVPADLDRPVFVHVGDLRLATDKLGQARDIQHAAVRIAGENQYAQRVLWLQDRVLRQDLDSLDSRIARRDTGRAAADPFQYG